MVVGRRSITTGRSEARLPIVHRRDDSTECKPFELPPIDGQGRVSKTDVPDRYPPDTPLDQVLDDCEHVTLGRAGIADIRGSHGNYVIDASRLAPENMEYCLFEWESHRDQIYALSLCNSKSLDISSLERLVMTICTRGFYRYLVELNLGYTQMSQKALHSLCFFVDPVTAGYCPLRRLILTHAQLASKGVQDLMRALVENVVIEELFLTANAATSAAMPSIVKFLSYGSNGISAISLGDNGFTAADMKLLARIVKTHPFLKDLQVHNNPMGEGGADALMEAIRDRPVFDTINLSNCGLVECGWAGRLRVTACLSHLYLAHNQIDDGGLQSLCGGLEACGCLRYLDISYNEFTGSYSQGGLGDILKRNHVLTTIIVSGNVMPLNTWTLVAAGMLENESLLRLDCTYCELTLQSAEALCRAMEVNDICTCELQFNDLPVAMLADPRQYRNNKKGPGNVQPMPLTNRPGARSLRNSQAWRVARINEVNASKQAYHILQKQEAHTQQLFEDQRIRDEALGDVDDARDDSSSLFHASTLGLSGVSGGAGPSDTNSFGAMTFDLSLSAFGPPSTTPSMEPSGESVKLSVGAHRQKALHRFKKKDDSNARAIGGKRTLKVAYGHLTTVLGSINVSDYTTYAEAKELIKPLVAEYCGGETSHRIRLDDLHESTLSAADVVATQGLGAADRRKAMRAYSREKSAEAASRSQLSQSKSPIRRAANSRGGTGRKDSASTLSTSLQWNFGSSIDDDDEEKDYGETAKPLRNYAEDFSLLQPSGQPIDPIVAKVRPVWVEASATNYTILVRPAGWINIPKGPKGDEGSVSLLNTPRSLLEGDDTHY